MIGGADVNTNEADKLTIGAVPVLGAFPAATNIISKDGTDYSKFEGGTGTVAQSVNDITFTHLLATDRTFAADTTVALTAGEEYTVSVLVTANTMDIERPCIVVNNNGNMPIGAGVTGIVSYTFTATATESVFVRFGPGADSAGGVGSLTITDMRMVEQPMNGPSFVDGSAASASYVVDKLSCSPTWPSVGSMTMAVAIVGYGGDDNPVATARIFNNTNLFLASPGNLTLFGSGASPSIAAGVVMGREEVIYITVDWNCVDIGITVNDGARQTAAETDIPAGTLYLMDVSGGTASLNGVGAFVISPKVLSTSERQAVGQGLKNIVKQTISNRVAIIACYGDSTTAGAAITQGYEYPALLAEAGNYSCINRGVGGYTPTQIKDKYIADGDLLNPSCLVLCDVGDNAGTAASQITQFNAALAAQKSGEHLVIGRFLTSVVSAENAALLAEYGASNFLDLKPILQAASGEEDFASLRMDAVHLNAAGNAVMAEAVNAKIVELLA